MRQRKNVLFRFLFLVHDAIFSLSIATWIDIHVCFFFGSFCQFLSNFHMIFLTKSSKWFLTFCPQTTQMIKKHRKGKEAERNLPEISRKVPFILMDSSHSVYQSVCFDSLCQLTAMFYFCVIHIFVRTESVQVFEIFTYRTIVDPLEEIRRFFFRLKIASDLEIIK